MTSWRSSRIARQILRIPPIGRIPLGLFIRQRQRATRLYSLLKEYGERVQSWWSVGRQLPAGLWAPKLLNLYFNPWVVLGRVACRPQATDDPDLLSVTKHSAAPTTAGHPGSEVRICVYVNSQGNFFHSEIAELLSQGLQASGCFHVERRNECDEPDDTSLSLVVSPHEFYSLGRGKHFLQDRYRSFRKRSNLFLAEQPGSKHFSACLPFVAEARRTFDINYQSASLLRELGVDAHFLPVGHLAAETVLNGDQEITTEDLRKRGLAVDWGHAQSGPSRPIDIAFTGVLTRRRAEFFSRNADVFSRHRCVLALPTAAEPLVGDISSTLTTHEATALSQRSKILLNIHRNEAAYFEWHRIMIRGLWQKALVVSEPSPLPPGLKPGEHLMEAPLEEIPELLNWLLETPEGRSKAESVRLAGHRFLVDHYDLGQQIKNLEPILNDTGN